jgi:hypothetical protein
MTDQFVYLVGYFASNFAGPASSTIHNVHAASILVSRVWGNEVPPRRLKGAKDLMIRYCT